MRKFLILFVALLFVGWGVYEYADGISKLQSATIAGDNDTVRRLITAGADVDARDNDGYTALMTTGMFGHADTARVLIEAGADVDAKINHNGYTALEAATYKGHIEITKMLIEAGANDVRAMIGAKTFRHTEIVEILNREIAAREFEI